MENDHEAVPAATAEAAPTTEFTMEDGKQLVEEVNSKRPREDDPAGSSDIPDKPTKRPRENNADDENDEQGEEEEGAGDNPNAANSANGEGKQLSKNQQRKLRRQMMRTERKQQQKLERRDKKHEKNAAKQQERMKKAEELAESMGVDVDEALLFIKKQEAQQKAKPYKPAPVPIAIIIDCDFEKYMHDNELVSLSGQITRGYSMNRGGRYVSHLLVSSWGGKLKERFETTLRNTHKHWRGTKFVEGDFVEAGKVAWDIMTGPKGGRLCPALDGEKPVKEEATSDQSTEQQIQEQNTIGNITEVQVSEQQIEEVAATKMETDKDKVQEAVKGTATASGAQPEAREFSTDSIVYLSADSPNILDKLEPNTSYVIGGLVDRNREKGLCQRRAEEKGIRTAKLPIGKYMEMASRQVLATNHVVEIMSKWLETRDWGEAFVAVIPKRKGGQLKHEAEEDKQKQAAAEGDAAGKDVVKPGATVEDIVEEGNGEQQVDGQSDVTDVKP